MQKIENVIKRDGTTVPFDKNKILIAITKASESQGFDNKEIPQKICDMVLQNLESQTTKKAPNVEEVQDIVEKTLVHMNYPEIAKAYIIYRHEHNKMRTENHFTRYSKNAIKNIIKRSGEIVPFSEEKILQAIIKAAISIGKEDNELCTKLFNQVIFYINDVCPPWETPSVEEIQDIVEKVLIKNNLVEMAKSYILYREEHSKKRKQQQYNRKDFIPYHKLLENLWFCVENKCETLFKLNDYIKKSRLPFLINQVEKNIDTEIDNLKNDIIKEKSTKIIFISGPICSGKIIVAQRLRNKLEKQNIRLKTINIDWFTQDDNEHDLKDAQVPKNLNITELKNTLLQILDGKTVSIKNSVKDFQMEPDEILTIIDNYGLVNNLRNIINEKYIYKVYIETLSQIKDNKGNLLRWNDIRLCRAMLKDKKQGKDISKTIENWHYIRRREMKYILPCIVSSDFIINSFTIYELFFIRNLLYSNFSEWQQNIHTKHLSEFSSTILRIYNLINDIQSFAEKVSIPEESILNQFV